MVEEENKSIITDQILFFYRDYLQETNVYSHDILINSKLQITALMQNRLKLSVNMLEFQ